MIENKVLTLENIKSRRKDNGIKWIDTSMDKDGNEYPLKTARNLEQILIDSNITVKFNEISKEEEYYGLNSSSANAQLTEIVDLQTIKGLKMPREQVMHSLSSIGDKNRYNPFLEMLKENENNNTEIIKKVFDCIKINPEYIDNYDHYSSIFVKWLVSVVHLAHNTLQNDYNSHGVLVLQGGQGCYKSTFARKLMPNAEWFKGDKSLDANSTDSISQNTKYILVEWGELDSTLKGEQAKLKQFITSTSDEYRKPYQSKPEKYARITSYIGTVNKKDFLKDETGSRRFWIIPVEKCDIDKMNEIDMVKFWGAVYHLYKQNTIKPYLDEEEIKTLSKLNKEFNSENDISIILNEKIDWSIPKEQWVVYSTVELCDYLMIKEKKALANELMRREIDYKVYKVGGKSKRGYKIPRFEVYYN